MIVGRAIHNLASKIAIVLDDEHSVRFLERLVTDASLSAIRVALRETLRARRPPRSLGAYFTALVRRSLITRPPNP